jgi:hypothetical protein
LLLKVFEPVEDEFQKLVVHPADEQAKTVWFAFVEKVPYHLVSAIALGLQSSKRFALFQYAEPKICELSGTRDVHGLQSNTLWQAGRVEESNTITKQHGRKGDLNLANEPLPKALPRDIRANHQDVFACRSGDGSRYHIDDVARR